MSSSFSILLSSPSLSPACWDRQGAHGMLLLHPIDYAPVVAAAAAAAAAAGNPSQPSLTSTPLKAKQTIALIIVKLSAFRRTAITFQHVQIKSAEVKSKGLCVGTLCDKAQ